jgi:hypothetical protein
MRPVFSANGIKIPGGMNLPFKYGGQEATFPINDIGDMNTFLTAQEKTQPV